MSSDENLRYCSLEPVAEGELQASVHDEEAVHGQGGADSHDFGSLLRLETPRRKKTPVLMLDAAEAEAAARQIQLVAAQDFANAEAPPRGGNTALGLTASKDGRTAGDVPPSLESQPAIDADEPSAQGASDCRQLYGEEAGAGAPAVELACGDGPVEGAAPAETCAQSSSGSASGDLPPSPPCTSIEPQAEEAAAELCQMAIITEFTELAPLAGDPPPREPDVQGVQGSAHWQGHAVRARFSANAQPSPARAVQLSAMLSALTVWIVRGRSYCSKSFRALRF